MKPIETEHTNSILKVPPGQENEVMDLHITRLNFGDGTRGVESCCKLSKEELDEVMRTGRIYFTCMGDTHPPIPLTTKSLLD